MIGRRWLNALNYLSQFMLWVAFISIPLIEHKNNPNFWNSASILNYISQHLALFILFYANYFYLIPVTLNKKGMGQYLLVVLLLFCLLAMLIPIASVIYSGDLRRYHLHWNFVIPAIQLYAISAAWRLLFDYLQQRLREKKLAVEKMESELKFLRSQINPHFLFNTLNNINSLIRTRPEEAEKSVVRLSGLMRYMLKSGNLNRVLLKDELDYLRNYIALQRIRLSKEFNLDLEIPVVTGNLEIEPLLLVSFIENCFKHGVHDNTEDFIRIKLAVEGNKLHLITENRMEENSSQREIASGIGLKNVRTRLDLCYPNNYSLTLLEKSNTFRVDLEILLL